MMDGTKAHYDGTVAFSQTDFTEDLKKLTVPVLVMHGDDDQMERDARLSRISRLGHDGPPGGGVATSRPPGLTQPRRAGVLLLSAIRALADFCLIRAVPDFCLGYYR